MREYRESSREKGNRAEQEVYLFLKNQGIDIRRNEHHEVDFTVWNNGSPLYHIEVEHKTANAEPMIKEEGIRFLQHKVDKYADYALNVYYVIVLDNWNIIYIMDMLSIQAEGVLVEPPTTRRNMGLTYLVKASSNNLKRRSL
jgi:hypothetical protein